MNKEEKRLAAERRRAARLCAFEERCARLREEGREQKDCTVGLTAANVWGILSALPFAAAAAVAFILRGGALIALTGSFFADLGLLALAVVASIPVHEGLHGLLWAAANRSFSGIRFGIAGFTPYCACEKPMGRAKYMLGSLAPFALLGAAPCAAAFFTRSLFALIFGIFGILCAGADIFVSVRAMAAGKGVLLDHPERCGFYLFRKPAPQARQ